MEINDLTGLSLSKLRLLQINVTKELALRERTSKGDVFKKLEKMAKEAGFSLQDLVPRAVPAETASAAAKPKRGKKQAEPKPKAAAKYRHPSNLALAWTGHGRKPAWFVTWLTNGGSTSALENAAQRFASGAGTQPEPAAAAADEVQSE
jgi:DNA-binding protein H-NS